MGDPTDGCPVCGAGSAKPYKAPPAVAVDDRAIDPLPRPAVVHAPYEIAFAAAERWAAQHPEASLAEAFVAGFQLARGQTMSAPPVTVDIRALAPEGKAARTIIAALETFLDRVLPDAKEEVESGEWCSKDEIEQLIEDLKKEHGL